jgi:hypothetical protein
MTATMVEYEVIWPDGGVYANRHGETRLPFAEASATAQAIGGRWRLAETEEFTPGSVTDTCGRCFERFDLTRPADQYTTVRNWGTDTWDLVCPDCDDAIAAEATTGEHAAPLDSLGEHLIPTGAHWTTEGPRGENWVIRWNRTTGTVQARRWSHDAPGSFSAEAADLPAARGEVLRIAGLVADGKTSEG